MKIEINELVAEEQVNHSFQFKQMPQLTLNLRTIYRPAQNPPFNHLLNILLKIHFLLNIHLLHIHLHFNLQFNWDRCA